MENNILTLPPAVWSVGQYVPQYNAYFYSQYKEQSVAKAKLARLKAKGIKAKIKPGSVPGFIEVIKK